MSGEGPNAASGLASLGCALMLLPFALVCGALIVAIALQTPGVGLIALLVVGAFIGGRLEKRRKAKQALAKGDTE